ncbi:response regulator [candidate division FCPU426 bacterium]|nr:response regulator [candidate division FCPU426 bacterium]
MPKPAILIIEDDRDIMELITFNLQKEGYQCLKAGDGEQGLQTAKSNQPHLISLDLMLPGMDGLEVCRRLKQDPKTAGIPILMLTAKGEEADIVAGLELGAEDYITKPFSPKILIARIRAVLRRRQAAVQKPEEELKLAGLTIHRGRHEVLIKGKKVELTLTEFKLLDFLASHPGWTFTRNQIINGVQGEEYIVTDRSVDVQIVGLRKKLGLLGKKVESVRGVGYRYQE